MDEGMPADVVRTLIRWAKADAWDEALASLTYEDGSPVEIVSRPNPYRLHDTVEDWRWGQSEPARVREATDDD